MNQQASYRPANRAGINKEPIYYILGFIGFLVILGSIGFEKINSGLEDFRRNNPWLPLVIPIIVVISIVVYFIAYAKEKRPEWREHADIKRARRAEEERISREAIELERQRQELERQRRKEAAMTQYWQFRKEIEQMPIYERWRQDVLKKCGSKCQMCGSNKNLEVHHRISFYLLLKQNNITSIEQAFECKPLWEADNGEALCKECHDKMGSSKNRQTFISKIN